MDTRPATQAVETLIDEYYKLVFHTIYGLTNDWEESQDLTQETFHQALKGIDAARSASGINFHAKAWLLRIALNTVRMQRRRRNIFRFIPFSRVQEHRAESEDNDTLKGVDEQAAPVQPAGYGAVASGDLAETIAERDLVQRVMAHLPEDFRVCLLLSIVAGLSPHEIATLLDIKEPAVRQRLARARKRFQQEYARESGEELVEHTSNRHTTQPEHSTAQHEKNAVEHSTTSNTPHRLMLAAQLFSA